MKGVKWDSQEIKNASELAINWLWKIRGRELEDGDSKKFRTFGGVGKPKKLRCG